MRQLTEGVAVSQIDWNHICSVAYHTQVIDREILKGTLIVGIPIDVSHLQVDVLDSAYTSLSYS